MIAGLVKKNKLQLAVKRAPLEPFICNLSFATRLLSSFYSSSLLHIFFSFIFFPSAHIQIASKVFIEILRPKSWSSQWKMELMGSRLPRLEVVQGAQGFHQGDALHHKSMPFYPSTSHPFPLPPLKPPRGLNPEWIPAFVPMEPS